MPILDQDARRAYNLAWVRKRRQAWITSRGGSCENCGSTDRLEVDHVERSSKTMSPASIWTRRADVRAAELAKCQVLCYSCHLAKTVAENRTAPHGSHTRYTSGCRCEDCREAHAATARAYRARVTA